MDHYPIPTLWSLHLSKQKKGRGRQRNKKASILLFEPNQHLKLYKLYMQPAVNFFLYLTLTLRLRFSVAFGFLFNPFIVLGAKQHLNTRKSFIISGDSPILAVL